MKKLCILVLTVVPLFGLVWSEDPSLTEEQKQERREINKRIAENMREMQKEKQRWIREQIEKGNQQEPDFHVGGPGTSSPSSGKGSPAMTWGRPSIDDENREPKMGADPITWGPGLGYENQEKDTQENSD